MDKNQFVHPSKSARKRIFWIVAGVSSLFSILLFALLFAIGSSETTPDQPVKSKEIIDLLSSSQQLQLDTTDPTSSQVDIILPDGGWVQQTDGHGNLVQQYRCDSLDPNPANLPDGWISMTQPEVELILSDNRIVRITGESAIANAPNQVLETGEITGDVIISMFDFQKGESITSSSVPSIVMTTKQASFDNFIGEILCDHEVRIVSPKQTLVGSKLTVRFNDKDERIEYVRLEELDYIELIPDQYNSRKTGSTPKHPRTPSIENNKQHRVQAAFIGDPIEYYIVSLFDNVLINQGSKYTGRSAQANKLTIAFSNEQNSQDIAIAPISSTMIATGGFPATVAAISLNAVQEESSQLVRITCNGGLTMIPLFDHDLMPSSPSDTRLELFGTSTTPVTLIDDLQKMEATGDFLRHQVQDDRTDLYGYPASLIMNNMLTTTEHLWIARGSGKGAAVGSGKMTDRVQQATSTTLEWADGVDFTFDSSDGSDAGALKKVICTGGVSLTSEGSIITCELLDIAFASDENGSSSPSLAIATGNVKATSETQVLFADEARLTFTQDTTNTVDGDAMFGGSKADRLNASGDVQVLLNDGGRAFCDYLDGHITQDTAKLTGNVLIAYERMLMNRGDVATLTLDQSSGKGRWEGPGQALFLEEILDVISNDRIQRPTIQTNDEEAANFNNISMRANWKKSMRLDQKFNNGAGSLDLTGQVDVRSKQSQHERGQMTGEDLRLEFDFLDNDDILQSPVRELRRVIARNNAQIEHRLQDTQDSTAPPIVYYISGNHIEFDAFTHEALAVGEGELVLRDLRTPNENAHQSALAGRGTTRFTWDNKLKTTKITDILYRIAMTGNVEMVHQGIDGGIGMLTSDSMVAFAKDPNPEIAKEAGVSQLTFRAMDLQQINSIGNVYVATKTRKVDCDAFDYNLMTGIAQLSAHDDRTVSIVTQGTSYPVRATSIIWNMDPTVDTISIHGLQGSN